MVQPAEMATNRMPVKYFGSLRLNLGFIIAIPVLASVGSNNGIRSKYDTQYNVSLPIYTEEHWDHEAISTYYFWCAIWAGINLIAFGL